MLSPDDEQLKLERQREYSRDRQRRWRERLSQNKRERELELGRERQRNRRANLDGEKRQRELQLGRERQRLRRARMSGEQREQEREACRLRMRQKRQNQLNEGNSRQSVENDQISWNGNENREITLNPNKVFVDAFLLHGQERIRIGSDDFTIQPNSTNSTLSVQVISKFQIDPLGFEFEKVSLIVGKSELPIVDDRPRKGVHYCFYYAPINNDEPNIEEELLESNSMEYQVGMNEGEEQDLLAFLGDNFSEQKPEPTPQFDKNEISMEPSTSHSLKQEVNEQQVDYHHNLSELFAIPFGDILSSQLLACDIKDIMAGGDKTLDCYIPKLVSLVMFELPVEARRELVRRISKRLMLNCQKLYYPSKVEIRTFLHYLFRDHPNFSLEGFLGIGRKRGFLDDCISHFRRSMSRKGLVSLHRYQSNHDEFNGDRSVSTGSEYNNEEFDH